MTASFNDLLQAIRRTLPHYLSPEVAAVAGLSIEQLRQVVAGYQPLDEDRRAGPPTSLALPGGRLQTTIWSESGFRSGG